MKKYLFPYYFVILSGMFYGISSEEQMIPPEMLLSPENSIPQINVEEEEYLETNDTEEELSSTHSLEDCINSDLIPLLHK